MAILNGMNLIGN